MTMCQSSKIRIVKLIRYQSNLENVKQKNINIKNAMSAENVVGKKWDYVCFERELMMNISKGYR